MHFSIFFPFLFAFSLLHPADPVHNILKDILEVEVKANWFIIICMILEIYTALCYSGTAVLFILHFVIIFIFYFFTLFLPLNTSSCQRHRKTFHSFRTAYLQTASEDKIIWVYRSIQCLVAIQNMFWKTTRVAFHSIGFMSGWILSTFALIRYYHLLLNGGGMGISLLGILIVSNIAMSGIYYFECSFSHRLEASWVEFKQNLLTFTSTESAIHKTAKSFRPVTLMTEGPYFNVNLRTFLDWSEACVNNLFNLLVSF